MKFLTDTRRVKLYRNHSITVVKRLLIGTSGHLPDYQAGREQEGGRTGSFPGPRDIWGPRCRITVLHVVDVQRSNPYNFRLLQSA